MGLVKGSGQIYTSHPAGYVGMGVLSNQISCAGRNIRTCFLSFFFFFVALRLMPTAMVIAGRSVHLTTLFPGQA